MKKQILFARVVNW